MEITITLSKQWYHKNGNGQKKIHTLFKSHFAINHVLKNDNGENITLFKIWHYLTHIEFTLQYTKFERYWRICVKVRSHTSSPISFI